MKAQYQNGQATVPGDMAITRSTSLHLEEHQRACSKGAEHKTYMKYRKDQSEVSELPHALGKRHFHEVVAKR